MSKVSPLTLQPYLLQLSDRDPQKRNEARDELLAFEERGSMDTPMLIDLLFESDINVQVYILQALGRKGDERAFPFLDSFFDQCRNALVLVEALEVFAHLGNECFQETVIDKLTPKKSKKKEPREGDTDALIRVQCTLPALKYLRECANENAVPFLLKMLEHRHPSVRFEALMVFHKRNLGLSKSKLIKVNQTDENRLNRELADLILNPAPPEENELE